MERVQKQEQINTLKGIFTDAESLVLTSIEGLNAEEITGVRKKLHENGIQFKVFKNKLANLALKDSDASDMCQDFTGSTAIAWSDTDAVGPAKFLMKFEKTIKKFKVKSGFNAKSRLDHDAVKALSKLPSLDELRSTLLGLLQAVPAKLLAQVNAPAQNLVGVVQAKCDKEKEEA